MQRTTIMLPEGLKQRAEQKSTEMHISLGEFLRKAAEDFLERQERKWAEDPLAGDSYTISAPAPVMVSENVDRYIYGKKPIPARDISKMRGFAKGINTNPNWDNDRQ